MNNDNFKNIQKVHEPFISVIVPVYNVEEYLNKCLECLVNQTYKNFEIILIDDGSTDNSGKICDEYSKEYNNIICVHKMNSGMSDARNLGIDLSSGDYLVFVDSDDLVSTDLLNTLINMMVDEDDICVVKSIWGDNYFYDFLSAEKSFSNTNSFKTRDIYCLMLNDIFLQSVCGKLYPKSIFEKERFCSGRVLEDVGLSYKLYDYTENIRYCDIPLYYYYQRNGSIMHRNKSVNDCKGIYSYYERLQYMKKYDDYLYSEYLRQFIIMGYKYYYIICKKYKEEIDFQNDLLNKIKESISLCDSYESWSLKAKISLKIAKRFPYCFGFVMDKVYK